MREFSSSILSAVSDGDAVVAFSTARVRSSSCSFFSISLTLRWQNCLFRSVSFISAAFIVCARSPAGVAMISANFLSSSAGSRSSFISSITESLPFSSVRSSSRDAIASRLFSDTVFTT